MLLKSLCGLLHWQRLIKYLSLVLGDIFLWIVEFHYLFCFIMSGLAKVGMRRDGERGGEGWGSAERREEGMREGGREGEWGRGREGERDGGREGRREGGKEEGREEVKAVKGIEEFIYLFLVFYLSSDSLEYLYFLSIYLRRVIWNGTLLYGIL